MSLRIALFGQAPFGRDSLVRLLDAGHEVAAVYVPPDGRRPDPLGEEVRERGLPLFRHRRFRRRGEAIPELVEEHRSLGVDLNVLAFVTAILPPEIVDAPPHGSLCFHPSLLPAFRGGNALAWQIMLGATESGVTVFRPDAGVDTGPIVVQKGPIAIDATDSAASLYFDKLYPLGLDAIAEAVAAVAEGRAVYQPQDEAGASHQGLVGDEEARIDWDADVAHVDRWIRGCDPAPGAWALRGEERVRLFGGRREPGNSDAPAGQIVGFEAGRAVISGRGGLLSAARARVGERAKQPAAESGLGVGDRLR